LGEGEYGGSRTVDIELKVVPVKFAGRLITTCPGNALQGPHLDLLLVCVHDLAEDIAVAFVEEREDVRGEEIHFVWR
jgi:hypothetical protein